MLLPDHFGAQEQSREDLKVNDVDSHPDYKKIISMYHNSDLNGIIESIKSGSAKTPWTVWFIRNLMLDSISYYLKTSEDSSLTEFKQDSKRKAKFSYDMLRSGWFKSKLLETDLNLDQWVWEAIEETYSAALKLNK